MTKSPALLDPEFPPARCIDPKCGGGKRDHSPQGSLFADLHG